MGLMREPSRMIRGRYIAPVVASQVRPHTRAMTIATLQPIAGSVETFAIGLGFSVLSNAYPSRPRAKPKCQKMNSHEPVWMFAPRSPVGENAPVNVSACGMTISAVKRYPTASAKRAREREIEYCANSRTAVIESEMKTIASRDGKNALSAVSGVPANGATAANATRAAPAAATADQVCATVGGRSVNHAPSPCVSTAVMALTKIEPVQILTH
jgi:hypothetical protein